MLSHFTNTQLIVAAAVLVFALVVAAVAYFTYGRARSRAFRARFGPEYDRAVLRHGSRHKAERNLAERELRVKALELRDLGPTERERFIADWQTVQARFVDHPKSAVTAADELISSLIAARGYPDGSFEQRTADMSVRYPSLTEGFRQANNIAVRPGRIDASTEELRKAMIQYRTIFDELVQAQRPHEKISAA
jgi:hypothetical protein